jgi:hypothetical protein
LDEEQHGEFDEFSPVTGTLHTIENTPQARNSSSVRCDAERGVQSLCEKL